MTKLESPCRYTIQEKSDNEQDEQQHQHQIRFINFSFFPVTGNGSAVSRIDGELDNVVNVVDEMDAHHHCWTPCNYMQSERLTDSFTPEQQHDDNISATSMTEPSIVSEQQHDDNSSSTSMTEPSIVSDSETNSCSLPTSISDLDIEFLSFQTDIKVKFKPAHEEKWNLRFKEFLEFVKENGHTTVPVIYPQNPKLARWVKRQRQQYKLRQELKTSSMTTERIELLSSVGFIWDCQDVNWREKLDALKKFHEKNGHCRVPREFKENNLGAWIKIQRRQYKLYREGKPSHMNPYRVEQLEKLGFD